MLEYGNKELNLTGQTRLLSLNRTGIYYKSVPPDAEEVTIKHKIDEIYTKYPFYGYRKITQQLKREEVEINHKRVLRYMNEMGISAICPGPNLSKRNMQHLIYPYLLRNLKITKVNQVWGIDITYIRLNHGWMYLVAVIDWFSRYVLSKEMSQTLEIPFVIEAVKAALECGKPEIWNSDQGSHFTSPQYTSMLLENDIKISMDGKGRALDNIFTERLWRTIKYENVYIMGYETPKSARVGITDYLKFYNEERIHQSLGYCTPAEIYYGYKTG